jgi:hypothetical protein
MCQAKHVPLLAVTLAATIFPAVALKSLTESEIGFEFDSDLE